MIGSIVRKLLGSRNERELTRIQQTVEKVNALEPQMAELDDAGIRA